MFKNYLKVALRISLRQRVYAGINLVGLVVGVAVCILILLLVRHEWCYDRYHHNAERIYMVTSVMNTEGFRFAHTVATPAMLAPKLAETFPEVIQAVRFLHERDAVVRCQNQLYKEKRFYFADAAVFEVFSFSLGRGNAQTALQEPNTVVISPQAARKYFGDDDPIGRTIALEGQGIIIGVVEDFHSESLHETIRPTVLQVLPRNYRNILVRIRPENIPTTLEFLAKKWREFAPNQPFEYAFLDQQFDALHKAEEKLGAIFGYFAFIAIVLAGLGLFGLTAFSAERRTKEIGIRKALGASVMSVVRLLSKELVGLVLLANIIAWPMAWYAMNRWLQDFAYRIDMGWWMFTFAGGAALLIALLTVSAQAIKAALANPVEALRYE